VFKGCMTVSVTPVLASAVGWCRLPGDSMTQPVGREERQRWGTFFCAMRKRTGWSAANQVCRGPLDRRTRRRLAPCRGGGLDRSLHGCRALRPAPIRRRTQHPRARHPTRYDLANAHRRDWCGVCGRQRSAHCGSHRGSHRSPGWAPSCRRRTRDRK
jgi:hypothetical protein